MKRLLLALALTATVAVGFAQGAFTIRRPVDNTVVREVVQVRIPKGSIPGTGFVGIWVNGRFLEAVAPIEGVNIQGNDFVYTLDTKRMGLADGPLKIEAVLYADAGSANRILNRSSVDVTLDNRSSIRPPSGGFLLRYNMTPGREMTYTAELRQQVQLVSAANANAPTRASGIAQESEKLRYRYTFVNSFQRGDGRREGVVLMQPLTPKGVDSVFLTTSGNTEPRRYYDYNMAPIYMRIDDTGREVWGSVPFYTPFDGAPGDPERLDLYAVFPLPVLPARAVSLQTRSLPAVFQQAALNMDDLINTEKFSQSTGAARGTVEGIEWERGLRCIRIKNSIEVGQANAQIQSYDETYWYAIDLGAVIRFDRTSTITTRVQDGGGSGGGAGAGGGGGNNPNQPARRGLARGGWISDNIDDPGRLIREVPQGLFQGRPGIGRGGGEDEERSGRGGGGLSNNQGGNRPGQAGNRPRTRLVRVTTTISLIAE